MSWSFHCYRHNLQMTRKLINISPEKKEQTKISCNFMFVLKKCDLLYMWLFLETSVFVSLYVVYAWSCLLECNDLYNWHIFIVNVEVSHVVTPIVVIVSEFKNNAIDSQKHRFYTDDCILKMYWLYMLVILTSTCKRYLPR